MTKYRIMSNNQWKNDKNLSAWQEKGLDCSASVRAKGFATVFKETLPDIVGLQEVSPLMAQELMLELCKANLSYALVWGKDTPIIYRKDKFEVIDSDFALYPEEIDGLEGKFNNDATKSYLITVFRDKESKNELVFATTHLWWMSSNPEKWHYYPFSDEARECQIQSFSKKINGYCKKYDCSAILVGDFNTVADSKAVRYLLSDGYKNAHDEAIEYACSDNGLHPCGNDGYKPYEPKDFSFAIDHIFVKNFKGRVLRYDRYITDEYLLLSDHFPVYIDVEV